MPDRPDGDSPLSLLRGLRFDRRQAITAAALSAPFAVLMLFQRPPDAEAYIGALLLPAAFFFLGGYLSPVLRRLRESNRR